MEENNHKNSVKLYIFPSSLSTFPFSDLINIYLQLLNLLLAQRLMTTQWQMIISELRINLNDYVYECFSLPNKLPGINFFIRFNSVVALSLLLLSLSASQADEEEEFGIMITTQQWFPLRRLNYRRKFRNIYFYIHILILIKRQRNVLGRT